MPSWSVQGQLHLDFAFTSGLLLQSVQINKILLACAEITTHLMLDTP